MSRSRKFDVTFLYVNSSLKVIRLVVMMYVRFPLSMHNAKDLMLERGIDIRPETVRLWWKKFGPLFCRRGVAAAREPYLPALALCIYAAAETLTVHDP